MTELVSVIIPVYNGERFLRKCLTSISAQSHKPLEVICVDDGSTDSSELICKEYSKLDSRFQLIKCKENGGLSRARNIGKEHANGKFILFVDADDWLEEDAISILLENLLNNDADVSVMSFTYASNDKLRPVGEWCQNKYITISGREAIKRMYSASICQPDIQMTTAWNKLYRYDFIKDINFPEGLIYEDQYFIPQVYERCKRVVVSDKIGYYYRLTQGSITLSKYRLKKQDEILHHEELYRRYKRMNDREMSYILNARLIPLVLWHYTQANENGDHKAMERAFAHAAGNAIEYLGNPMISKKKKKLFLKCLFFRECIPLYWHMLHFEVSVDDCYDYSEEYMVQHNGIISEG